MTTEPDVPTALAEIEAAQARLLAATAALTPEPPPDDPIVASIADAEAVVEGEAATFLVSLDRAAEATVTVGWSTQPGESHVAASGTLTFEPGDVERTISVATIGDDIVNGSRSFAVSLTLATGAVLGRSLASGVVLDDDVPGEPDDPVIFMLEPDAPITAPIQFPADAWADLVAVAMVVRFEPANKHQKAIGAPSSQSVGQGGFGVGINAAGSLDVWRAGGGSSNQVKDPPPIPMRQAVCLGVSWGEGDLGVGLPGNLNSRQPLPDNLAALDMGGTVGAGWWKGQDVDPLAPGSEIRAIAGFRRVPTTEEWQALALRWAARIDVEPDPGPVEPPPPPSNEGLIPVDTSAVPVEIDVGDKPRQSWIGYGWGAAGTTTAKKNQAALAKHVEKLCEGLNATVVRFHAPINVSKYVDAYLPVWKLVLPHKIDAMFVSHYMYSSAGANGTPNPVAEVNALHETISAGVGAGAKFIATAGQNEMDGGKQNYGHGSPDYSAAVMADQLAYHNRLNALGRQNVIRLGIEWRHPTDDTRGPREYSMSKAAGRIGTAIQAGCIHIYNKGPNATLYDERWMTEGAGLWSTETGDMSSPRAAAIFINGVNNGTVVEIGHIGLGAAEKQYLFSADGVPNQWAGAPGLISRALLRGTRMRLCLSSDRPPGMSAAQAQRMLWHSGLSQRQPRHQVAAGKRQDGNWVLAAVSYAYGGDAPTSYAGGHYAAANQQLSIRFAELAGKNGSFVVQECSQGGSLGTPYEAPMRGGVVRLRTLSPGATAVAVGG